MLVFLYIVLSEFDTTCMHGKNCHFTPRNNHGIPSSYFTPLKLPVPCQLIARSWLPGNQLFETSCRLVDSSLLNCLLSTLFPPILDKPLHLLSPQSQAIYTHVQKSYKLVCCVQFYSTAQLPSMNDAKVTNRLETPSPVDQFSLYSSS